MLLFFFAHVSFFLLLVIANVLELFVNILIAFDLIKTHNYKKKVFVFTF